MDIRRLAVGILEDVAETAVQYAGLAVAERGRVAARHRPPAARFDADQLHARVIDERGESGLLYRLIKRLNPKAPVTEFVGDWAHTTEMKAHAYLPYALFRFGLMPPRAGPPPEGRFFV